MGERWATFDTYGTLIDWEGGVRTAAAELWPGHGPERIVDRFHEIEPLVQLDGGLTYREVLTRTLRAIAAVDGLRVPPGRDAAFAESLPDWPAFAEVPAELAELRDRGWKLATLTNCDPDLIAASARHLGDPFDLIVTAAEAGSYKPEFGHWEAFRARVPDPETHIHVAASLFHDIEPCSRMGLPVAWINRKGESSDLPRAAELRDLGGLTGTLAGLV